MNSYLQNTYGKSINQVVVCTAIDDIPSNINLNNMTPAKIKDFARKHFVEKHFDKNNIPHPIRTKKGFNKRTIDVEISHSGRYMGSSGQNLSNNNVYINSDNIIGKRATSKQTTFGIRDAYVIADTGKIVTIITQDGDVPMDGTWFAVHNGDGNLVLYEGKYYDEQSLYSTIEDITQVAFLD